MLVRFGGRHMAMLLDIPLDHESWMKQAIAEAELARGSTGDNPWVGCMLVDARGELLGRGHTQGPGEDHAEIVAIRQARARGLAVEGSIMYSTLEPCSFHGRTPACSRVIVESGVGLLVYGMRDPNPRVDGVGAQILRDGGTEVLEGVCEREVRRQLGSWVLEYHPHEPLRRARELAHTHAPSELVALLADLYAIEPARAEAIVASLS
jgi:diaminohydroxyphosphoribosylaminopyrimidine deaminase / 5-amino-6-(5-phosphoribosylamino)uracil reductase